MITLKRNKYTNDIFKTTIFKYDTQHVAKKAYFLLEVKLRLKLKSY